MFSTERLQASHDLTQFASGNDDLDEWLRDSALPAGRSGTARTYVWVDDKSELMAYYAINPTLVLRSDLPRSVGRGAPDAIPGFLIGKLARHVSLRGQRIGSSSIGEVLLIDALSTVLAAATLAGGRVIVVDAIDDLARDFYERNGFRVLHDGSMRLVMKTSAAAKTIGAQWPPS